MDLIEIDVICADPLQARINRSKNMLAGEPLLVRPGSHRAPDLCRQNVIFALARIFAKRSAGHLFTGANRIDVSRVEEIDPAFNGLFEEGLALLGIKKPWPHF